MTRTIDERLEEALANREPFKDGKTEVEVTSEAVRVWLHGALIAKLWRESGVLDMSMAGYPTKLTLRRLNNVCRAYDVSDRWRQRDGKQWFGPLCVEPDHITTVRGIYEEGRAR